VAGANILKTIIMKSLHIFLLTIAAMSVLLAANKLIPDLALFTLLLLVFVFGTERTVKAIQKGK